MSRGASPASLRSASGLSKEDLVLPSSTSDYPGSDCSSNTTLDNQRNSEVLGQRCYTNEDVVEDIEDGTSSVLSSSISQTSGADECLAYRAPWATPPTATFEGHNKQLTTQQKTSKVVNHCHDLAKRPTTKEAFR
jgi:hypothetical protein